MAWAKQQTSFVKALVILKLVVEQLVPTVIGVALLQSLPCPYITVVNKNNKSVFI